MADARDKPSDEEAERAAEEVTSQDALLPGERTAVESSYLDDAVVWLHTYEELFAFKQALLATLLEQRRRVQAQGLHEVQNDEILLTREADRLSRRLEFWQKEIGRRAPSP